MNKTQEEKLKALAGELAKDIKTGEDLSSLSARLVKLTVEAALAAEMENHLGYPPHSARGHHTGNSRNGSTPKILKGASVRSFDRNAARSVGEFRAGDHQKRTDADHGNGRADFVLVCQRVVNP